MAGFDAYDEHDAVGLADLVKRDEVSPADLLETAIDRAEQRDPIINAMSQKLYDHGRMAIENGLPDGPFSGVPFLLKDAGAHKAHGQVLIVIHSGSGRKSRFPPLGAMSH